MIIFKACLSIMKRHVVSLTLYFGIFMLFSVIMPLLSTDQYTMDFSEIEPNFTIINRDGDTPLSDGLTEYLSRRGVNVNLDDNKEALQDAAFFHATDYIAILPAGFRDSFFTDNPASIENVITTESAKSYYTDSLVNQYLNQARMYSAEDDITEEALVASVLRDLSVETNVEMKRFGAGAPVDEVYRIYLRMVCYIIIVLILLCISNITSAFRRPDLRMRNLCAPARQLAVSGQQILCGVMLSVTVWLLMTALGYIIFGSKMAGADKRIIGLLLINTFLITLIALAIASLASLFIKSPNAQNAVANFVSLGLCFLGGVFVPLDLMGEGILAAAKFNPVYWYVITTEYICALTSFSGNAMAPVWQAMLTQLAFAAAILCVALMVGKQINLSEKSFGSVRTELEQ